MQNKWILIGGLIIILSFIYFILRINKIRKENKRIEVENIKVKDDIKKAEQSNEILNEQFDNISFKFSSVNQITKTLVREKDVATLKKSILDMYVEVNSSKFGVAYTNNDGVLVKSNSISCDNTFEFQISKKDNLEIWNYLEEKRIIKIEKLKEFKEFEGIREKIKSGYMIVFLVANEKGESEISDLILLGEKMYGEYEERNIEFLEILSGEIEIILENLANKKQIEKQNQDLTGKVYQLMSLNLASKVINSTLDKDEIFKMSLEMVTEIISAKDGILAFFNDKSQKLQIKEVRGEKGFEIKHKEIELDKNEIEYISKQNESVIILETENENCLITGLYQKSKAFLGNRVIKLVIIMKSKDEFLGLITLGSKQTGENYNKEDFEMLKTLVGHISSSIYNAKLYTKAITDGMTKLYLHTYFKNRLQEEIALTRRYKRKLSVIMLDIDHFKIFNDTYGHQTGDVVLKEVASILKNNTRESDLVARYGGEEFVIMLLETDEQGGKWVAEHLRKMIEEKDVKENDNILKVTVSLGVSTFNYTEDISSEELIKEADVALYYSKENGRNQVNHYSEIKE